MNKDCERVQDLISKTVSLVCKSSLPFEKEVKVEGLLGITLDANQVFLVRINETFAKLFGSTSVTLRDDRDRDIYPTTVDVQNVDANVSDRVHANIISEISNECFDDQAIESNADFSTSHSVDTSSQDANSFERPVDMDITALPDGVVFKRDGFSAFNLSLPPLIEIDSVISPEKDCNSEDSKVEVENCVDLQNREIDTSAVKIECDEPDVMIVQPVGTDEDADLVSLCSTLDEAISRVKKQDDDEVQLLSAPPGILDGFRRGASGRVWDRQIARRRQLKDRRSLLRDTDYAATNSSLDATNGSCNETKDTCSIDLTQEQSVDEDIKPVFSSIDNANTCSPIDTNHVTDSADTTCTGTPLFGTTVSMCSDPGQLLANLGFSVVGLTPVITLPIASNSIPVTANAGTTMPTNSSKLPSGLGQENFNISTDVQNIVASITKCQPKSSRGSHLCSVCGAHFLNADDHLRHMRTHTTPAGAVCASSASLASVQWKVTCPFCDLLFGSTSTRNRHIRVVHERRVKWTCPVCFHKITRSDNVKYHSCVKARRIVLQKGNEPVK